MSTSIDKQASLPASLSLGIVAAVMMAAKHGHIMRWSRYLELDMYLRSQIRADEYESAYRMRYWQYRTQYVRDHYVPRIRFVAARRCAVLQEADALD